MLERKNNINKKIGVKSFISLFSKYLKRKEIIMKFYGKALLSYIYLYKELSLYYTQSTSEYAMSPYILITFTLIILSGIKITNKTTDE